MDEKRLAVVNKLAEIKAGTDVQQKIADTYAWTLNFQDDMAGHYFDEMFSSRNTIKEELPYVEPERFKKTTELLNSTTDEWFADDEENDFYKVATMEDIDAVLDELTNQVTEGFLFV